MKRKFIGFCTVCVALLLAACGDDPEDTFYCCSVQELCKRCECQPHERDIADSENETACESWFEVQEWNVSCGSYSDRYDEEMAFAACAE